MPLVFSCILALCEATERASEVSLGNATRIDISAAEKSIFSIAVHKVTHALMNYSTAKENIAIRFANEFGKIGVVEGLGHLFLCLASSVHYFQNGTAQIVHDLLQSQSPLSHIKLAEQAIDSLLTYYTQEELTTALHDVAQLASIVFAHLLIASTSESNTRILLCIITQRDVIIQPVDLMLESHLPRPDICPRIQFDYRI